MFQIGHLVVGILAEDTQGVSVYDCAHAVIRAAKMLQHFHGLGQVDWSCWERLILGLRKVTMLLKYAKVQNF